MWIHLSEWPRPSSTHRLAAARDPRDPARQGTAPGVNPVGDGLVSIPRAPTGDLLPPPGLVVSDTVTLTWDGETCTYADSGADFDAGTTVRVDFVNNTSEYRFF